MPVMGDPMTCPSCGREGKWPSLLPHVRKCGTKAEAPEVMADTATPPSGASPFAPGEDVGTPTPATLAGRLKSFVSGADKSQGTKEKKPREPKAKNTKARVAGDEVWQGVWGFVGRQMIARQWAPFAGAAMTVQSQAIGPILDEELSGSIVDRVAIQPLARNIDAWRTVETCFGLPLVCEVAGRALASGNRDLFESVKPEVVRYIKQWFVLMAPVVAKQRAEEKKQLATLETLQLDWLPPGTTLDEAALSMVDHIFDLAQPYSAPIPEEMVDEAESVA